MKKIVLRVVSCFFLLWAANLHASVQVNKAAPDFSIKSASGKTVKLSDYKGKKVILEWTNADCPFVKKHYGSGNMQALQKKYTAEGLVWLSVISSAKGKQGYVSPKEALALTSKRSASPSEILLDEKGELGKMFGAKTTPHMYLIDEKGTLAYMGAIDSIRSANPEDIPKAKNYIELALSELKAGKKVSTPVTQAYGCGVKY